MKRLQLLHSKNILPATTHNIPPAHLPQQISAFAELLLNENGFLTQASLNSVTNRMQHRFNRRNPRNPSMEIIECAKIPPRDPKQNVVAGGKQPNDGYVCEG